MNTPIDHVNKPTRKMSKEQIRKIVKWAVKEYREDYIKLAKS